MVVTTVEDIKRNFTKKEIDATDEARCLYVIVGRPSQKVFEEMIKTGKILNNPITLQDYRNALKIYGVDLGVLKGKTTRKKPDSIKVEIGEKPKPKNIVLSIDIMYFTGIPFLVTVSRNIRFLTATLLSDRKKSTIMKALQQVFRVYQGRGHRIENVEFLNEEVPVHTILADNEFQALRDDIEELGINVHIVMKDEHVPEVERQNRVIKERARATVQTLPYR
jgi:hypothetical protein